VTCLDTRCAPAVSYTAADVGEGHARRCRVKEQADALQAWYCRKCYLTVQDS
jgi:hypothetical protein